jgi:hypothetical protein
MEATGAAFWRDTIAAAIEMRIGRFLHQDLKCEKGVWNHKCYLRCDKKIAPVLFHSCVVQYRGYPVEYFVICCDLLSSVRLQLTAVIQLALWMLVKLDKISETPVFSRLSDLAPIITLSSMRRTMPVAFINCSSNAFRFVLVPKLLFAYAGEICR